MKRTPEYIEGPGGIRALRERNEKSSHGFTRRDPEANRGGADRVCAQPAPTRSKVEAEIRFPRP